MRLYWQALSNHPGISQPTKKFYWKPDLGDDEASDGGRGELPRPESQQFTMLQRSWNETEEQISAARRSYNASVTSYNNAVEKFPSSLFAAIFRYRRKEVFVIDIAERQNISAKALFSA